MTTTNSSLHDAPQISAKPAPGEKERCVLAYSGGLDTSVCIKWLQEEYDLDVIAVVGDLGQAVQNRLGRGKVWKSVGLVDRAVLVGDAGHPPDDRIRKMRCARG